MKVLSLGLGVQSTGLYLMSSIGELPRCDYAIFADLGFEKKATYQYLDFLLDWQKKNDGIEIIVDRSKNLYQDLLSQKNSTGGRLASIPAFTKNDDGLNNSWFGRVWCNPPYGLEAAKWLEKLAEHGNGIALIFARTETDMFWNNPRPASRQGL